MKIVSKAELMRQPKGTLFADFHSKPGETMMWPNGPECILHGPCDPGEGNEPVDFFFITIGGPDAVDSSEHFDACFRMADDGEAYPIGLALQREGLYDPSKRYLVWEPEDVNRIIALLQGAEPKD